VEYVRRGIRRTDQILSEIGTEGLVEDLERSDSVVLRRSPIVGGDPLGYCSKG
jgi:hypothetical protein